MTLAAMRARGFTRPEASALSRHVALPVIAGASVLKGVRLAQRGLPPGMTGRFALGVGASLVSTLAAARLVPVERGRCAVAVCGVPRRRWPAVTLRRLR